MKKKYPRYIILILIILSLSTYLFLKKENRDNYALPGIQKIEPSEITGLILEKKGNKINFTLMETAWVVSDKGYPADASLVKNMLSALQTFEVSTLVSEKEDLLRYELDPENEIRVTALKGTEPVFAFSMGKQAPTGKHTFVRLGNDKNIYHAPGNFRSEFNRSEGDFRDKKVMEFTKKSVKSFTIEKDGISKTFVAKEDKTDTENDGVTWQSEDGKQGDEETISSLLSTVAFLDCETYLTSLSKSGMETKKALCSINLNTGKNVTLTLFQPENKEEGLTGISSMNDYVFSLRSYNGDELVTSIEKLLGISREEETGQEK